jgi:hypothetical protein
MGLGRFPHFSCDHKLLKKIHSQELLDLYIQKAKTEVRRTGR